jgi:hypothetical protein
MEESVARGSASPRRSRINSVTFPRFDDRGSGCGALIVADGASCRHQIHDSAGCKAIHAPCILSLTLEERA